MIEDMTLVRHTSSLNPPWNEDCFYGRFPNRIESNCLDPVRIRSVPWIQRSSVPQEGFVLALLIYEWWLERMTYGKVVGLRISTY
jgi:hypothetical protein